MTNQRNFLLRNWRNILQRLSRPMQNYLKKRHIIYNKNDIIDITKKFYKFIVKGSQHFEYDGTMLEREGIAPLIIASLIAIIPAILSFFNTHKNDPEITGDPVSDEDLNGLDNFLNPDNTGDGGGSVTNSDPNNNTDPNGNTTIDWPHVPNVPNNTNTNTGNNTNAATTQMFGTTMEGVSVGLILAVVAGFGLLYMQKNKK